MIRARASGHPHPRLHQSWRPAEDKLLARLVAEHQPWGSYKRWGRVAEALGRTGCAVQARWNALSIQAGTDVRREVARTTPHDEGRTPMTNLREVLDFCARREHERDLRDHAECEDQECCADHGEGEALRPWAQLSPAFKAMKRAKLLQVVRDALLAAEVPVSQADRRLTEFALVEEAATF